MDDFKEEKKEKNVFKILFIIVFIVLMGLIGYLTYVRIINSKWPFTTEEVKQVQQQEQKENINGEVAIPAVKKDLVYKVNSLLMQIDQKETSYNAFVFADYLLKNLELTDAQKQIVALSLAKSEKINISKDKINAETIKEDYDLIMDDYNDGLIDYGQKSSNEVEGIYKEFFNSDIEHKDTYQTCPMYFYDEINKVYYWSGQCGGLNGDQYPVYIDEIYVNNNEAYVYVYVGYIIDTQSNCVKGVCNGLTTYKLYNGIDKAKVIKENVDFDEAHNYLITNSTKEQFSKYKFTFKQDENKNYYFSKIERVEK